MRIAVAIPVLDEEDSIGTVVRAIPRDLVSEVIVADGGSRDATKEEARRAGATVIDAGRGYGRALPCCIAPFSQRGYENYTLGDATQQTLREIWSGETYSQFRDALISDHPPSACAGCGMRWSL